MQAASKRFMPISYLLTGSIIILRSVPVLCMRHGCPAKISGLPYGELNENRICRYCRVASCYRRGRRCTAQAGKRDPLPAERDDADRLEFLDAVRNGQGQAGLGRE